MPDPVPPDPVNAPADPPARPGAGAEPERGPEVTDARLDAHRVDASSVDGQVLVGVGFVKDEVASLVARLRDPARAAVIGAPVPRGILLHGAPGIGTTATARHVAGRLGDEVAVDPVVAEALVSGAILREVLAGLRRRHGTARVVRIVDASVATATH